MIYSIIFGFFCLVSILILFWIATSFFGLVATRVPFVRTTQKDLEMIFERISLNKSDLFLDLGSGDGRVALYVCARFNSQAAGYEAALWAVLVSRIKAFFYKANAVFYNRDFFKHSWKSATVIYCYLYPPIMPLIAKKAKADCRPGTIIIARDFPITELDQTDYFRTTGNHEVFVYKI